jgi:hypothetical protein
MAYQPKIFITLVKVVHIMTSKSTHCCVLSHTCLSLIFFFVEYLCITGMLVLIVFHPET